MLAVPKHVTAEHQVGEAFSNSVDDSSLSRLDPIENVKLDQQNSIYN